jgi:hypothetical protein
VVDAPVANSHTGAAVVDAPVANSHAGVAVVDAPVANSLAGVAVVDAPVANSHTAGTVPRDQSLILWRLHVGNWKHLVQGPVMRS